MDILGILKSIKGSGEFIVICFFFVLVLVIVFAFLGKQNRDESGRYGRIISTPMAILFVLLGLAISFVILAYLNKFSISAFSGDPAAWGQMGDFFGGMLNPILAFASFIALLYTIKLQSAEMKDSRKELEQSRRAQQETARLTKENLEQEKNLAEYKTLQDLLSRQLDVLDQIFEKDVLGHSVNVFQNALLANRLSPDSQGSLTTLLSIKTKIREKFNSACSSTHGANYFINVVTAKRLFESFSVHATRLGLAGEYSLIGHFAKRLAHHCCMSFFTLSGESNSLETKDPILLDAISEFWKMMHVDPIGTSKN